MRLAPMLAMCLAACTMTEPSSPNTASAEDGYNLEVDTAFRSSDGQWAWKWRNLQGGLTNFRTDPTSDGGIYLLIPVAGTDPQDRQVSYLCVVFLSSKPQPGPCEAEKSIETFAPLEVLSAKYETDLSGQRVVIAEIGLQPPSWLNFEPRTIDVVKHPPQS
jgi:hypothetical protein